MNGISIDSVNYRVRVVFGSLARSFSLIEGSNSGTSITARKIRDLLGTEYGYELNIEPDPRYPDDYDSFFEAISAPVESHYIALPYGQTTLEFEAQIESGSDTYKGKCGAERWGGLKVVFTPIEPQRR